MNTECLGELVFSREEIGLIGKHMVICLSFLYGIESAIFVILCSYTSACLSTEWTYMIQVATSFLISWNYGVYRGWRSINNRLCSLKQLNDIQEEQAKLRQALRTLQQLQEEKEQKEKEEKQSVFHGPEIPFPSHDIVVEEAGAASIFKREDRKDVKDVKNDVNDGKSLESLHTFHPTDVQHPITPYNTPHHSPRHALHPPVQEQIFPRQETNAIVIPVQRENKKEEKTIADSLTYTPQFPPSVQPTVIPVTSESVVVGAYKNTAQNVLYEAIATDTKIMKLAQLAQQFTNDDDDDP
jgi:hypothetical protein